LLPAINPHLTAPLSKSVTSAETHCTTTLVVHKQHCSPQHSPSTEPLSRCETSAETHCTNSITNPVIENNK